MRMRLDALIMRKLGYGAGATRAMPCRCLRHSARVLHRFFVPSQNMRMPPLRDAWVAWTQSRNMQAFSSNKAQLLQYFPSVKGWINWWSLPVHAVMLFPGVRQDMLGETDEMYGHLPSTNNTAEASNSMESRFCRHNVELVPSIHDSFRITLRQQKLHEGILSGATSPTHFNRNRTFFLLTLSQAK